LAWYSHFLPFDLTCFDEGKVAKEEVLNFSPMVPAVQPVDKMVDTGPVRISRAKKQNAACFCTLGFGVF
jgi:hypothetical protein